MLRYGNNPETVRQGWRRRQGKPDALRRTLNYDQRHTMDELDQFVLQMRAYDEEFRRMRAVMDFLER